MIGVSKMLFYVCPSDFSVNYDTKRSVLIFKCKPLFNKTIY